MSDNGIVKIHGKAYETVALRVQKFRDKYPDYSLLTEVVERDADCVVMRAEIWDAEGRVIATGHAEEYRTSSQINKTSALENAETSAIGRALAAFGLGGTEFATANEVQNAIHQQQPSKSVFANASLRNSFFANVVDSFDCATDIASLETLRELNVAKFKEMRDSGNEHDAQCVEEMGKRYKAAEKRLKGLAEKSTVDELREREQAFKE